MKRSRIPEDFEVSDRIVHLALKNGWPEPESELDAFKDYHLARGSLMVDWEAAFRTWLRNAARFRSEKHGQGTDATEPKGFAGVREFLAKHNR
jgi:hypothetical protein